MDVCLYVNGRSDIKRQDIIQIRECVLQVTVQTHLQLCEQITEVKCYIIQLADNSLTQRHVHVLCDKNQDILVMIEACRTYF